MALLSPALQGARGGQYLLAKSDSPPGDAGPSESYFALSGAIPVCPAENQGSDEVAETARPVKWLSCPSYCLLFSPAPTSKSRVSVIIDGQPDRMCYFLYFSMFFSK